jgi:hypothetical protein
MNDEANQHEPVRDSAPETEGGAFPDLMTVSQAYEYLIDQGVPRSKKTIRKWCRLDHVDWKEISVPGGAKWLITRSSLDARIAEERLIDASLSRETGANPSGQERTETRPNRSEPVRDDALVVVLKEQLAHERRTRLAAEARNKELFDNYHEISLASTQMGIEIGKGMQEQARARRLAVRSESTGSNPIEISAPRNLDAGPHVAPPTDDDVEQTDEDRGGDNSSPATGGHPV